jgi:hypothetical protein
MQVSLGFHGKKAPFGPKNAPQKLQLKKNFKFVNFFLS